MNANKIVNFAPLPRPSAAAVVPTPAPNEPDMAAPSATPLTREVPIVGAFVGWSIPAGWEGTRDAVRAALAAHGLPPSLMGAQLSDVDAFVRSVGSIGDRLRADNPGTKIETTKARELCDATKTVYVIGVHGTDNGRWLATEGLRFVWDKTRTGFDAFVSDNPDFQDELWTMVNHWQQAIGKKDLTDMMERALRGHKTVNVASQNGTVFLPAVSVSMAETLDRVLQAVDPALGADIFPIADLEAARKGVGKAFAAALTKKLADAQAEWQAIWEYERPDENGNAKRVQDRRKASALKDLDDAKAEIEFYREALALKTSDLLEKFDAFRSHVLDNM